MDVLAITSPFSMGNGLLVKNKQSRVRLTVYLVLLRRDDPLHHLVQSTEDELKLWLWEKVSSLERA